MSPAERRDMIARRLPIVRRRSVACALPAWRDTLPPRPDDMFALPDVEEPSAPQVIAWRASRALRAAL